MFSIESDRLRIEIADPGEAEAWTTRFDYTGFITDVVLDRTVHFAASEPRSRKIPSSGGRGLCSAYRFDAFPEARVGDWVPRLGVGLVQKTEDQNFQNNKRYPCVPFDREIVERTPEKIAFRTLPRECLGYAAETSRRLWVKDNSLFMAMELRNTGSKPIAFQEYCHNFLTMDGLALGPDYQLELPQVRNLRENVMAGPFAGAYYEIGEHSIRPRAYSTGFAVFEIPREDLEPAFPVTWRLSHDDAEIAVEGAEFYQPSGMCVWSKDHMLCPEVSFQAEAAPGETVTWIRKWTFLVLNSN